MSALPVPKLGVYRRRRDDVLVEVIHCETNGSFLDAVTIRSARSTSSCRIENFWKKYDKYPPLECPEESA